MFFRVGKYVTKVGNIIQYIVINNCERVTRKQTSKAADKQNSHCTILFCCNVFFVLIKILKTKKSYLKVVCDWLWMFILYLVAALCQWIVFYVFACTLVLINASNKKYIMFHFCSGQVLIKLFIVNNNQYW
jgi:hypothetical protein